MREENFLNKRVAEIVELSGRQILSWSEKGLVVPFKESPGVGVKRLYDRANLLEFALAKILLEMGLGFRTAKRIIGELRRQDVIKNWETNFSDYYRDRFKKTKTALRKSIDELKKEGHPVAYMEELYSQLKESYKPEKPLGSLIYYFGNEERVVVIPWDVNNVLNLNLIKEGLIGNQGFILIDLGRIKETIDRKL